METCPLYVSFFTGVVIYAACANCIQVQIVTVIIGSNPMSGIQSSAPAIDVAFEHARVKYPRIYENITTKLIYKPNELSTCGETGDIMVATAGEVYDLWQHSNGFFILMSPGCSLEVFSLGDMARELKVPLVTSTAADKLFTDRKRYPTFVAFSSAGQSQMSPAMKLFVQSHKWRAITMLCDTITLYPGVGTWYIITCRGFKMALLEKEHEFQVYHETFDSRYNPDYTEMLLRAKRNSRSTHESFGNSVRISMVFVYPQAVHVPGVYDPQWKQSDEFDEVAFRAFKSVIKIQFRSPNWTMLEDIENAITATAFTRYNYSYTNDEKNNDVALSAFEAILTTSQILNETWEELGNMDGPVFSQKYLNRSFDMGFRSVDIGSNGLRLRNTEFCLFNNETGDFEVVWVRTFSDGLLRQVRPIKWYDGSELPPNEPPCGFDRDHCVDSYSGRSTVSAVAICVFVSALTSVFAGKKCHDRQKQRATWWSLTWGMLEMVSESEFPDIRVARSIGRSDDQIMLMYL